MLGDLYSRDPARLRQACHNPGWELGDEQTLRRVLRNTAWAEGA